MQISDKITQFDDLCGRRLLAHGQATVLATGDQLLAVEGQTLSRALTRVATSFPSISYTFNETLLLLESVYLIVVLGLNGFG